MNTLYIHIGTAKTGTTSIQRFCFDNQKILNQKGYYYPIFDYRYEDKSIKRNAHFLIKEDFENRQGVFREGMDQILELFKTYPNVILSDEVIWSTHLKKQLRMWRSLMAEAEAGGFQIKVIVYFRRQDLYLSSGWNQNIKGSASTQTWAEYFEQKINAFKMNYGTNLKKIASVVGKENITVRRFEPKRFKNGSLYADFLSTIGLELTDEYSIEQDMRNLKLAGNTHEIMRVLNGMPGMNGAYNEFFRKVLLSYADTSGREYPCEMLSVNEAQAYMDKYKKENEIISKEFLNGEELFDMSWKDLPKWEKDNPHMQDDLIRFVGACCIQMMEENQKMLQKSHLSHLNNAGLTQKIKKTIRKAAGK